MTETMAGRRGLGGRLLGRVGSLCIRVGGYLQRDDSGQHAHAVLEHLADGIVTLDLGGRIESSNRPARRLLGYGPGEMTGQSIDLLVEPGRQGEFAEYLGNRL